MEDLVPEELCPPGPRRDDWPLALFQRARAPLSPPRRRSLRQRSLRSLALCQAMTSQCEPPSSSSTSAMEIWSQRLSVSGS